MDKFLKRSAEPSTSESGSNKKKNRLYSDEYLKYGFTIISNKPQCVICGEVLSNESMKPSKLLRHLNSKHPDKKDKPVEFFERKLNVLHKQQDTFQLATTTNEKALLASYKVAYRVAKTSNPHTIAENLILPAAVEMVHIMIGEKEAAKLKTIPLSNNTIQRRISDMAEDIQAQVVENLNKCTYFSLQMDESTDISNCAQFITFVRYDTNNGIQEDILFCSPLETNTTGKCLFDSFVKRTSKYVIDWGKCIAICTDGAKAMTGHQSGLVVRLQEIMPNATWRHCFLHREALASKALPPEMDCVMKTIIKVVNSIKGKALQTRLFRKICEDMGAIFQNLLYHTEVRWLSRGNVLKRVFHLRAELLMYLKDEKSPYEKQFSDPIWLLKLGFLADIFEQLNILNSNLQGRDINIITATDKIKGFIRKIDLWSTSLGKKQLDSFQCIQEIIENVCYSATNFEQVFAGMQVTLLNLKQQLCDYFPEEIQNSYDSCRWILNPFLADSFQHAEIPINMKEQLIEISSDGMLKLQFFSQNPDEFWTTKMQEYPQLANEAVKCLVPFVTSYLCELSFSSMTAIKTKVRNRLVLENDIIVCVSNTQPRFERLVSKKQAHGSH